MRVFALSDIHVDYAANARWIRGLSRHDFQQDVLILAGDITHRQSLLAWCLSELRARFGTVLFVPGNHDLWVLGEAEGRTSLEKFHDVAATVEASGASMQPFATDRLLIAPLLGWYDYSFGEPSAGLREVWMDYRACRWPEGFEPADVARHFSTLNAASAPPPAQKVRPARKVITFSHFVPRPDLVPVYVPRKHRMLNPVLGSTLLERQLRQLNSTLHVYGHSHINQSLRIEGTMYVNNAFGYPRETRITAKRLLCIEEV